MDFDQNCGFSLNDIQPGPSSGAWGNYPNGVAYFLQRADHPIAGMEAAISGDVPIGTGLASSAAIEVASALVFLNVGASHAPEVDESELAVLCQRAENQFVGVNCGIMDQTISLLGEADHALFLDCRSLEYERIPLNLADFRIVVCNTKVKRDLASSEYNERRAECERGVEYLKQWFPGISVLRDVFLSDFKKSEAALPLLTQRRCRYVIEENERVLGAVEVLKASDLQAFGKLITLRTSGCVTTTESVVKNLTQW